MARNDLQISDKDPVRVANVLEDVAKKTEFGSVNPLGDYVNAVNKTEPEFRRQVLKELAKDPGCLPNVTLQGTTDCVETENARLKAAYPVLWTFAQHPQDNHWTLSEKSKTDLDQLLKQHELAPQSHVSRELAKAIRMERLSSMMYEPDQGKSIGLLIEAVEKYPEIVKDRKLVGYAAHYRADQYVDFMRPFRQNGGDTEMLNSWIKKK